MGGSLGMIDTGYDMIASGGFYFGNEKELNVDRLSKVNPISLRPLQAR